MTAAEVKSWRKAERDRLIAARESLDAATLELLGQRMDAYLWRSFPGLAASKLAFCWPIRREYDARRLAQRLRECGAVTALPVVVAQAAARLPRMASRRGPCLRPARHSVSDGLRSGRSHRGAVADERVGRSRLPPRLRARVLRPNASEPGEKARCHRGQLGAGQDEDHTAPKLGYPDGLGSDRARHLPARSRRL